ncbi:MAG: hypothetical protein IIY49_03845 [Eubacterium sp.]|nr:hypothetical protein [Eubacterium sp.]
MKRKDKKKNIILVSQIVITFAIMGALVVLYIYIEYGNSRKVWFKDEFYNGKYVIEATYPSDGVHNQITIAINNKAGDVLWNVDDYLDYNVDMTEDYYELVYEKDYLKIILKNENKGIGESYRVYYEDLDKCNYNK